MPEWLEIEGQNSENEGKTEGEVLKSTYIFHSNTGVHWRKEASARSTAESSTWKDENVE